MCRNPSRNGFTLVELLAQLAIIATLLGLLLPAMQRALETGRQMMCANNLKLFGVAMHQYISARGTFPPQSGGDKQGEYAVQPDWSSRTAIGLHRKGSAHVKLLPYMEQEGFYAALDFSGDIVNQIENNETLRTTPIHTFVCPSEGSGGVVVSAYDQRLRAQSCYGPSQGSQAIVSNAGACDTYAGNLFGNGPIIFADTLRGDLVSGLFARSRWACKPNDVRDGLSKTIAFGEVRIACNDHYNDLGWYRTHAWFNGTSVPINFPTCVGEEPGNDGGYNATSRSNDPSLMNCNSWNNWTTSIGFKSRHPGGAQFVLADGAVRFLSEEIDFLNYNRLGDRRDGESIVDVR